MTGGYTEQGSIFKVVHLYAQFSSSGSGGGGPGVWTPYFVHDVGLLTLGPKLDHSFCVEPSYLEPPPFKNPSAAPVSHGFVSVSELIHGDSFQCDQFRWFGDRKLKFYINVMYFLYFI